MEGWRPDNDEAKIEFRKAVMNKKAKDRKKIWRLHNNN